MNGIKIRQRYVLALLFTIILAFTCNNSFAAVKSKIAAPKINVAGMATAYQFGDAVKINISLSNYTKNVTYRVVLENTLTKTKTDIIKAFSKAVAPKSKQTISYSALSAGAYKLYVYAKPTDKKDKSLISFVQAYKVNKDIVLKNNKQVADYKSIKSKLPGNVTIQADQIKLSNADIAGTLTINPGTNGSAYLTNVKAARINILSGGANSIHFSAVQTGLINIDTKNQETPVRLLLDNKTVIHATSVNNSAILEVNSGSYGNVLIDSTNDKNKKVEFRGNFNSAVQVMSNATLITKEATMVPTVEVMPFNDSKVVLQGSFGTVNMLSSAELELSSGTMIKETLNIQSSALLTSNQNATVSKLVIQPNDKSSSIRITGNVDNLEIKKPASIEIAGNVKELTSYSEANVIIEKDAHVNAIIDKGDKLIVKDQSKEQYPTGTPTPVAVLPTPTPTVPSIPATASPVASTKPESSPTATPTLTPTPPEATPTQKPVVSASPSASPTSEPTPTPSSSSEPTPTPTPTPVSTKFAIEGAQFRINDDIVVMSRVSDVYYTADIAGYSDDAVLYGANIQFSRDCTLEYNGNTVNFIAHVSKALTMSDFGVNDTPPIGVELSKVRAAYTGTSVTIPQILKHDGTTTMIVMVLKIRN